MKKRIIFIVLLIIFALFVSSCATQRQAQIQRQKQGMMLLDNTELHINRKYFDQKYNKHRKPKYYKNKNNYAKKRK